MKSKKTGTHMLKYVLDGKMHHMDAHKLGEHLKMGKMQTVGKMHQMDAHKLHERMEKQVGKTDMLDMHKLHEHVELGHKKKVLY